MKQRLLTVLLAIVIFLILISLVRFAIKHQREAELRIPPTQSREVELDSIELEK